MPNPAHQFVVKGEREDGTRCYFTGKKPDFLRDRALAYPMTLEGARDIAARYNVSGLVGFSYDIEPYLAPA